MADSPREAVLQKSNRGGYKMFVKVAVTQQFKLRVIPDIKNLIYG